LIELLFFARNCYFWTNIDKSHLSILKTFGQRLRKLRESNGLLLRQVAANLGMDTALISKFERDERIPGKRHVLAFADYYHVQASELLPEWLSDKIIHDIKHESYANEAIKIAEKKLIFYKKGNKARKSD
jgi:HTH-type transcriptional regulator, competence development regulator